MDIEAIAKKASFIDEEIVVTPESVSTEKGAVRMKMILEQYPGYEAGDEQLFLQEHGFKSLADMSSRLGIVDYSSQSIVHSNVDGTWVATLLQILALVTETEENDGVGQGSRTDAVEIFLRPFEKYISNQLNSEIKRVAASFENMRLGDEFVKQFCAAPRDELKMLVTQTLILEVHVAKHEHEHAGSRYTLADYTSTMGRSSFYEELFEEYATLGRRLVTRVLTTVRSRRELLNRLLSDEQQLLKDYLQGLSVMTGVSFSKGDKHNGGRSVTVIYFEGGKGLVYKPRSMQAEALFFGYIERLSSRLGLSLMVPSCFCKEGYGWQEYIEHLPADGHFAFSQFYEELGVLLAAAYAFGLTDLHHENIVASGAHPVLIDAETLFAPQVDKVVRPGLSLNLESSDEARTFTCLHTGILPTDQNDDAAHIWGAAYSEGRRSPFEVPIIPSVDSLDSEVKYDYVEMGAEANAPYYGSEAGDWTSYETEVIRGFELAYRHIKENKAELVGPRGLIDEFNGAPVRIVLKATMAYSIMLMTSNHPDYMREGTEVERLFSYVWRFPSLADPRIWFSELKQMRRLDVPFFSVPFAETKIVDTDGTEVADIRQDLRSWWSTHVNAFDDDDLERQLWFIRASYVTSVAGEDYELDHPNRIHPLLLRGSVNTGSQLELSVKECASEAAREVTRRLCRKALLGNKGGWYSITVVGNEKWSVQPVAMDLYNGDSGIGYALMYLGLAFADRDAEETSVALARQVSMFLTHVARSVSENTSDSQNPPYNDIGLYGAIGGGIYFLSHVVAVLGDEDGYLKESLAAITKALMMRRPDERYLDVVSGSAGLIEALRSLSAAVPEVREATAKLAEMHARNLCSTAEWGKSGSCSWQQDHMGRNALVGYSHGASGVVNALADASVLCDTDEFRSFIDGGLVFEKEWRDTLGFWPDLRDETSSSPGVPGMISWCHGAPGVALARLQLLEKGFSPDIFSESGIVEDMLDAIEETVSRSLLKEGSHYMNSMALCHGRLGSLEILSRIERFRMRSSELFSDCTAVSLLQEADTYWRSVIVQAYEDGLVCGVPRGLEVPGVMTGLSGIGLSLMRYGGDRWNFPLLICADIPRVDLAFD
ncbi:type 2 lanthipeptide synthetase LanM [Actinomyces wuliandei]|uniref:type 2 lanthipeptide synthetase LanM n=1 Tax=Actinomyces wuliandei TaxID=2057743 RepID=UPI0013E369D3|nr:type 2 lanthipeptide synthetase LanM [Actinomyces wuliandei]